MDHDEATANGIDVKYRTERTAGRMEELFGRVEGDAAAEWRYHGELPGHKSETLNVYSLDDISCSSRSLCGRSLATGPGISVWSSAIPDWRLPKTTS